MQEAVESRGLKAVEKTPKVEKKKFDAVLRQLLKSSPLRRSEVKVGSPKRKTKHGR